MTGRRRWAGCVDDARPQHDNPVPGCAAPDKIFRRLLGRSAVVDTGLQRLQEPLLTFLPVVLIHIGAAKQNVQVFRVRVFCSLNNFFKTHAADSSTPRTVIQILNSLTRIAGIFRKQFAEPGKSNKFFLPGVR